MKQLTVRGIPEEIEKLVKMEAEEKKISLNKAFISLVTKGVSLAKKRDKGGKETAYHDLDSFSGLWSEAEAKMFEKNLSAMRKIDNELWTTKK